jgi:hypothetical protein
MAGADASLLELLPGNHQPAIVATALRHVFSHEEVDEPRVLIAMDRHAALLSTSRVTQVQDFPLGDPKALLPVMPRPSR